MTDSGNSSSEGARKTGVKSRGALTESRKPSRPSADVLGRLASLCRQEAKAHRTGGLVLISRAG
jgi:hypothetical protein